jgi:hypothetical protein
MSELPPDYPSDPPPRNPPDDVSPTGYGASGYGTPPPPSGPMGTAALPPLPFEDPTQPWLSAFFQTIGIFVQNPKQGYQRMRLTGDLLRPVVYALVLGSAGYILSFVWQAMFEESMKSWLPASDYDTAIPPVAMLWFAALSPLIFVFLALINTIVSHVCLLIVGSGKSGLAATFRVVCYSQTAMIVMLVPLCGSTVVWIWSLVLEIVGFSVAHKTSYGRAAIAVFIPLLLCCACIGISFSLFGAAIMSQLQGMK